MPVQYSSILAEAEATRARCGLFDVSHMGELTLAGPGAAATLDALVPADAGALEPGQGIYALLLNSKGGTRDDLIIFRLTADTYLLVVNASNTEKDREWVRSCLRPGASLEDRSESCGLLALQGPQAAAVLAGCAADGARLAALPPFGIMDFDVAGVPCQVSHTGYTGEEGYEVYTPWEQTAAVWEVLERHPSVTLCGLGARDVLRIEAGYPLYGHELSEERSPLDAGLGWTIRRKSGFVGAEAIAAARVESRRRTLRGLVMHGRSVPRQGWWVERGGDEAGQVTSGTFSPHGLGSIALAVLDRDVAPPGAEIEAREGTRVLTGTVVALPFKSWPRARKR